MTRKLSVLILIALFVTSIVGAQVFAAKAVPTYGTKLTGNAGKSDLTRLRNGSANDPLSQGTGQPTKPQQTYYNSSLGYNIYGTVINIGITTQYDITANYTLPTTIDLGNCGGQPTIMGVYMDLQPASNRFIGAYSYPTNTLAASTGTASANGGGYPAENATPGGIGFGAWHIVAAGGTQTGQDIGCGINAYTAGAGTVYPNTNNLGYVSGKGPSEGVYIWPSLAMDNPSGGGGYIAQMVAHESPPDDDTTGYQTLVYYRSAPGVPNPGVADAIVIDSITTITGCIAQDPNSDDVAIVYVKPRVYTDTLWLNGDVVYVVSSNNGNTWSTQSTIWSDDNDTANTIVGSDGANYFERGFETTALYTSDGCLHVAFRTIWSDTGTGPTGAFGTGGYGLIYPAKLYHWSDCNPGGVSLIDDATGYGNCTNGWASLSFGNACKINLAECSSNGNLYAVYNKNFSAISGDTTTVDCSAGDYANLDIVARTSSTGGLTWGSMVNLTDTRTNGCASGDCASELHLGTTRYGVDSLFMAYIVDLNAGVQVGDVGATNNPVRNMEFDCFNMNTFAELSANPSEYTYPFNTQPSVATATQTSVVSNTGNVAANATVSVNYISGSGWLNLISGGALNVPVGFSNTANLQFAATGPATEGLYQAEININYDDGSLAAPAVLTIPVDLYDFNTFCLPENQNMRTGAVRLAVNQASETSDNTTGSDWYYFGDSTSYLFDGFLVMGNSANNLTYSTYGGGGNVSLPTASNPFGFLYAEDCTMSYDSTTNLPNYRVATGRGVNRDTTIEFRASFYCSGVPGAVDNTTEFWVGKFEIYAGPNFAGTISGLDIGYYADWDIPSDSSANNSDASAANFAVLQQGDTYTLGGPSARRWAALAGYSLSGGALAGKVFSNYDYIYPESGFENDTLWNWLNGAALPNGQFQSAALDTTNADLSSLIITHRNATLTASDTLVALIIFATENDDNNAGSSDILGTVAEAKQFICDNNIAPTASVCQQCKCGDADGSGGFSIGDAVYIINYIFGGGPAPNPLCLGDADGSGGISIGDAVYLINYIFGGGPAPHCP